ncbi:MAG: DUF3791 domain-containing protein [Thermoguttaceae bacterium]
METITQEQDFELFCLEQYRAKKNLNGLQALTIFETHDIFDFLEQSYEVLHTQGMGYILQEIEDIITADKNADKNKVRQ